MLWKRTIVMLAVFAALTLLAVLAAAIPSGEKVAGLEVTAIDAQAVTKIDIRRADGEYSLVKKDGQWRIDPGNYAVEDQLVERALEVVAMVHGGRTVSSSSANHEKYGVTDDALRISVQSAQEPAWTLLVGNLSADKTGNYVRESDDNRVYALSARLQDTFDREVNRWRNRTIVKFDKDQATRLVLTKAGATPLSFAKGDAGWTFDPAPSNLPADYKLDPEKIARIARSMANFRATDFDDEQQSLDRGLTPPLYEATVTLDGGDSVAVEIGAEVDEKFYARKKGEDQTYLIASYAAKNLQNDLDTLRDMHLLTFDAAQVEKVDIVEGKRRLTLEKKAEDIWAVTAASAEKPAGFVLDHAKVTSAVRSISTMQAKQIVGGPAPAAAKLGSPTGTLTLTLAGGVEKIVKVGAEVDDDLIYLGAAGRVFKATKGSKNRILKKIGDFKVSEARRQPQFDPAMLDKLPPQMREQFLQEQRRKILQRQMMEQMMKNADKQKPPK
ncbi:MAG: DUF4340 domain-containing protein [Candidatus Lernaella stagnicola]|nr:DUF4340 domain-containing protein [Candidatus Lernaella stagnicola]